MTCLSGQPNVDYIQEPGRLVYLLAGNFPTEPLAETLTAMACCVRLLTSITELTAAMLDLAPALVVLPYSTHPSTQQFVAWIRSLDNLRNLPILAMTPTPTVEIFQACRELRIDSCVAPTATQSELAVCIEMATSHRRELSVTSALLDAVVGIGLSMQGDEDQETLLKRILKEARNLSHADAGTLYLAEDGALVTVVIHNDTLGWDSFAASAFQEKIGPLPLSLQNGQPNLTCAATRAANSGLPVNLPDIRQAPALGLQPIRIPGYDLKSLLTIPLRVKEHGLVGVIQLLNRRHPHNGHFVSFSESDVRSTQVLAMYAASSLSAYRQQKALRNQLREMQIEIDEIRRDREVMEITATDYFSNLLARVEEMRSSAPDDSR